MKLFASYREPNPSTRLGKVSKIPFFSDIVVSVT